MPRTLTQSDHFQKYYRYVCTKPIGKQFDAGFKPELKPQEMLKIGVFGGAYFDGVDGLIPNDLPRSWFKGVKLSPDGKKKDELNYFGINASQPLSVWRAKGWIYKDDPHGWLQWYCRYYLGRRIPGEDERQIKRWKAMVRHIAQIKKHCQKGDASCHPKQRQALLHWAYDSRRI